MSIILEVREHTIKRSWDDRDDKPWEGFALWLGPLLISTRKTRKELDQIKEMLEMWKRDSNRSAPIYQRPSAGPAPVGLVLPRPTAAPQKPRDKEIYLGKHPLGE